jgi:spermidine/putrescine transport system substrate-binding protein
MTLKKTGSGMGKQSLSRRRLLATAGKGALAGAAAIGFPAIIGKAPISSAKAAFEGEQLIVVSWSGNYELVFREHVIDPFNAKYGTKAETVGGWDQMINQIVAAPADNPPYDIIVAEEFIGSTGLAENVYVKRDDSKIPNLSTVYPWFFETRPQAATAFGVPFGGGTTMLLANKRAGGVENSWKSLWDERFKGKVTMDSNAFWYTLSVPALTYGTGISDVWTWPDKTTKLIEEIEKLKIAKWYKDGAEQANIMLQEEALVAMSYSSDGYTFLQQAPDEFDLTVPTEGVAAWADWYFKIRGTHHSELADLFMNYLLEKETQDRVLANSSIFMARKDVAVPSHWKGYPAGNEDYHRMFQVITMEGWAQLLPNWEAIDKRWKEAVLKTSS